MPSRFSREDLAYDYLLDADQASPFGLLFARDKDLTSWTGTHEAAIESERLRYRETALVWKNGGIGSGFSRRTPPSTGRTAEGAILSTGISYGEWITSKVPDILMPSGEMVEIPIADPATITNARIHTARDFNGDVYLSTSYRTILVISGGTAATATVAYDGGLNYTGYELETFAGALWVTGGSKWMMKLDPALGWLASDITVQRRKMAVVYWTIAAALATGGASSSAGTGVTRLVTMDQNLQSMYHVAETTDPLVAGNWSAATPIVTAPYFVNDLVANNRTVWFAANNGVRSVNEIGHVVNLTEWMRRHYTAANGDQSIYSDGLIWFAHDSGLIVVAPDGTRQDFIQWAQFGHLTPNQTPIYGRPQVLAPGGDCIWVGYYAKTLDTSYLFQLLVDRSQGLSLRWSGPEAVFPGQGLDMVQRISPLNADPYLLIATRNFNDATTHLYKQSLPISGNPYVDWRNSTSHRFAQQWKVYLPRDDFDSTAPKVVRRYDTVAANLGNGNALVIDASADDGAYAAQGTASLSPRSSTIPSGAGQHGVNFNWRLTGTNTNTSPIVLEAFSVRASVLTEPSDVQTFPVVLAWSQTLNNGQDEQRDPYADWRRLRSYQTRGPITVVDTFGVTKTAKVEPGIPYKVTWDSRRSEWVLVAMVTVSTLQEPILYDSGFGYDDGASAYIGSA